MSNNQVLTLVLHLDTTHKITAIYKH